MGGEGEGWGEWGGGGRVGVNGGEGEGWGEWGGRGRVG